MKTQVIDFLLKNGFEQLTKNGYANPCCTVVILQDGCVIEQLNEEITISDDLNIYWLVGYLTYHNLIPKNYKK